MVANFSNFLSPGVRVTESTAGYYPSTIASHSTVYMVGSGTLGAYNTPLQVTSLADFTNQFGSSASEASVKLFFRNNQNGILYFIRASILKRFTVSIGSVAAGAYILTINGTANTYTASGGDNEAAVRSGIISAINATSGALVTAVAGTESDEFIVYADNPATVLTITSSVNLTATNTTPTLPTAIDYVYAVEHFSEPDDDLAQGFIIAPEAFQRLTVSSDRLTVANAMRNLASSEGYDWVALVDASEAADTVAELQSDSSQYTSALGHLAYFAPYGVDLEDGIVPLSAGIAASATKKYQTVGYQEPIGGAKYPLEGLKDLTVTLGRLEQDTLNPVGCNLVRKIRNKGILIWGMRTRSSDTLYQKINTRVIMNVLNGTARKAFDNFPFSAIDGLGILLHRIEETAISFLRVMYNSKVLFGATEQDAFAVECSFENNSNDDLEQGNVLLEIYAAPVPGLEKLLVNVYRVGLGQVQASKTAGRPQQ